MCEKEGAVAEVVARAKAKLKTYIQQIPPYCHVKNDIHIYITNAKVNLYRLSSGSVIDSQNEGQGQNETTDSCL